jgi:hypothetical protein
MTSLAPPLWDDVGFGNTAIKKALRVKTERLEKLRRKIAGLMTQLPSW